jgi:hypothetical protein
VRGGKMIRTYCLPVNITIDDENPNKVVKEIAETIYDEIRELLLSPSIKSKLVEIDYSIFVKTQEKDFI